MRPADDYWTDPARNTGPMIPPADLERMKSQLQAMAAAEAMAAGQGSRDAMTPQLPASESVGPAMPMRERAGIVAGAPTPPPGPAIPVGPPTSPADSKNPQSARGATRRKARPQESTLRPVPRPKPKSRNPQAARGKANSRPKSRNPQAARGKATPRPKPKSGSGQQRARSRQTARGGYRPPSSLERR